MSGSGVECQAEKYFQRLMRLQIYCYISRLIAPREQVREATMRILWTVKEYYNPELVVG